MESDLIRFLSNGSIAHKQSLRLMSRRVSRKSGQAGEVTNSVGEQAFEPTGVEQTGLPSDLREVGPSETITTV